MFEIPYETEKRGSFAITFVYFFLHRKHFFRAVKMTRNFYERALPKGNLSERLFSGF